MGDAGPATPDLVQLHKEDIDETEAGHGIRIRDVHVLVTGFGPFKSFSVNPSYMIASALSSTLDPYSQKSNVAGQPASSPQTPVRPPNSIPYRIVVHTYPHAVRVAYATIATLIPKVISAGPPSPRGTTPSVSFEGAQYDYIFHLGLAAGRDNYTLETIAHRDAYRIKDVDDRDGFISGEYTWKREGLPERLDVGWNKEDVLSRWEKLTAAREIEWETQEVQKMGTAEEVAKWPNETKEIQRHLAMIGKGRRAVVKLSRDAGRFACEFILFTSLATRWKEAHNTNSTLGTKSKSSSGTTSTSTPTNTTRLISRIERTKAQQESSQEQSDPTIYPDEKLGKVAFLHVPGGIAPHDIARGVRVAEAAILALVGSWEDGFRNSDVYKSTTITVTTALDSNTTTATKVQIDRVNAGGIGNGSTSGYESRGTGDA